MINFYDNIKSVKTLNPNFKKHKLELFFRGLICCGSGGGKSNLVMNLLYLLNKTLHRIIICTKAEEPLYTYLTDKIKNIEIYYNGEIPEFDNLRNSKEQGLVIFDDLCLDKNQLKIEEMYIRGRKLNWNMVYISQNFYSTPKTIRGNCNLVWLGRGMNSRDLNMILSEFALGNIDKKELLSLYNDLTKEPMSFMMIDLNKRNIRHNICDVIMEF